MVLVYLSIYRYFCWFIWWPYRFNNIEVQNEFLKRIPHLADVTLPTNYLSWNSKQIGGGSSGNSPPLHSKDVTKLAERADRGFGTAGVPHYMLVRNDDTNQRHMGILDQYRFNLFFFRYRCFDFLVSFFFNSNRFKVT